MLNLLAGWRTPAFDANQWWIDFRPLPGWLEFIMLVIGSGVLLAYVVAPNMSAVRRRVTLTICELLGVVAVWNMVVYYFLLARGTLYSGIGVPFSALVVAALFVVWRGAARREQAGNGLGAWAGTLSVVAACMFVFPLAQMVCFGTTDYRRPADAIVVFGARVLEDGSPSEALQDRMAVGVELYKQQLASTLILSGGQGADEPVNEAEVMKRMAISAGVNPKDIEIDPAGINTAASVDETGILLREIADKQPGTLAGQPVRVLVVSHFYHLPRIKMDYQRNQLPGYPWRIYTVPVRSPLSQLPRYMGREVAAQWAYYLGPLLGGE